MYLPLHIDRAAQTPLQDQIYTQLRQLITTSWLKADTRVIATRFLAEQLGVSRTTILLAYERLISEGYLETRPAVGTFVCSALPDSLPGRQGAVAAPLAELPVVRQSDLHPPAAFPTPWEARAAAAIDFTGDELDPALFPLTAWKRLTKAALDSFPQSLVHNPPQAGIPQLRTAIADWLTMSRGLVVQPEQVVVVSGRQQAYHIAARLFLREGGRVVVEAPTEAAVVAAFSSLGANVTAVPADGRGMDTAQLPEGAAVLAHVTPSHQVGLGGTLPEERRLRLIDWARGAGAYIIEDDCDGDFRYSGVSPPPIMALDGYGLVIHIGTFSKSLGAGLRLGYMVLPPELCKPAIAAKALLDKGNPWLEQAVLAEFIAGGEFTRHLRRIRKVYMERRDCLIAILGQHFGAVELAGVNSGTRLTWLLPPGFPKAAEIRELALRQGVGLGCLEPGDGPGAFVDQALFFGYSQLGERRIREGINLLAKALRQAQSAA
jgi:GntR family transcriptional regulator/MocR family aminotransferase